MNVYYVINQNINHEEPVMGCTSLKYAQFYIQSTTNKCVKDAQEDGYFIAQPKVPIAKVVGMGHLDEDDHGINEFKSIEGMAAWAKEIAQTNGKYNFNVWFEVHWGGLNNHITGDVKVNSYDPIEEIVDRVIRDCDYQFSRLIGEYKNYYGKRRKYEQLRKVAGYHAAEDVPKMFFCEGDGVHDALEVLADENYGSGRLPDYAPYVSSELVNERLNCLPPVYMKDHGFGFREGSDTVTHYRYASRSLGFAKVYEDCYLHAELLPAHSEVPIGRSLVMKLSPNFHHLSDGLERVVIDGAVGLMTHKHIFWLHKNDQELSLLEVITSFEEVKKQVLAEAEEVQS